MHNICISNFAPLDKGKEGFDRNEFAWLKKINNSNNNNNNNKNV